KSAKKTYCETRSEFLPGQGGVRPASAIFLSASGLVDVLLNDWQPPTKRTVNAASRRKIVDVLSRRGIKNLGKATGRPAGPEYKPALIKLPAESRLAAC